MIFMFLSVYFPLASFLCYNEMLFLSEDIKVVTTLVLQQGQSRLSSPFEMFFSFCLHTFFFTLPLLNRKTLNTNCVTLGFLIAENILYPHLK